MDMTNTILDILDKQVTMSPSSQQQTKGLSSNDSQIEVVKSKEPKASPQKEDYPDLFLPIMENYRISDHFCGYLDSLSIDNNPMVLVELNNPSYRYGMSIYAVDRVNGTMYGKFCVGYRMIPEKATVIPQYQHTSVEDEYEPAYENTLTGITNIATPIAKSTRVTQASHTPVTKTIPERDIFHISGKPNTGHEWCMAEHPFNGGRILCIYRSNKKDQYVLQRTKRKKKTGMGI